MLDAARFPAHELLVGHDCEQVVGLCRELTDRVEVVRGYLADDFTVIVKRSERGEFV